MEFRIEIARAALLDAQEYVERIRDINHEPDAAAKWFRGLIAAFYSLERNPNRCAAVPRTPELRIELRQLPYYSHRIIFEVDEASRQVTIHRVFHGRRIFRRSDLISTS